MKLNYHGNKIALQYRVITSCVKNVSDLYIACKMLRQPELLQEYNQIIQQQIQDGIVVEKVPDEEIENTDNESVHYLPHHGVVATSTYIYNKNSENFLNGLTVSVKQIG